MIRSQKTDSGLGMARASSRTGFTARRVLIGMFAAVALLLAGPVAAQASSGLSASTSNTTINGGNINFGLNAQGNLPATQTIYFWTTEASGGFLNLSTKRLDVDVNLSNSNYERSGGSCETQNPGGGYTFRARISWQGGGSSNRRCSIELSLKAGTPLGVQNGTLTFQQTGTGWGGGSTTSGSASMTATVAEAAGPVVRLTGPGNVQGSFTYAPVAVGDSSTRTFTLTNIGTSVVDNLSVAIGAQPSTSYSIVGGTCGASLALFSSCDVQVKFEPTADIGPEDTTLDFTSTSHPTATINLSAQGQIPVADLTVDPSSWDYADSPVGFPLSKAFTVTNTGNTTLDLTFSETDALNFPSAGGTCGASLNVNQSCTYIVNFDPQAAGPDAKSGSFTVDGATFLVPGGTSQTVNLTGLRVPANAAIEIRDTAGSTVKTSHDYGAVNVGSGTNYVFTVVNTGNVPVPNLNSNIALSGPESSNYSVQANNCPASLVRNATCQVTVRLAPQRTGLRRATLTVTPGAAAATAAPQSTTLTGDGSGITIFNDVNENLSNANHKRWLESLTVGGAAPIGDRIRVSFEVDKGSAQTLEDVLISNQSPTNDNPPAANTFSPIPGGIGAVSIYSSPGSPRAFVTAEMPAVSALGADIGAYGFDDGFLGLCGTFGGGDSNSSDRRVSFRLRDQAGALSGIVTTQIRFTDARFGCASPAPIMIDQRVISVGGTPQPAGPPNAVVAPNTPVVFGFNARTKDANNFTGINWRIRNSKTGQMFVKRSTGFAPCAAPCIADGIFSTNETPTTGGRLDFPGNDAVEKQLTVSFPSRGRWIVEAAPRGQNQRLEQFQTIGMANVNTQAGSPTISLTGAPGPRPATDSTYSITANVADPANPSDGYDGQGGRPQVIEWDLNNNPTDGPAGDGFELRFEGNPDSGVAATDLTQPFSTVGKTPGPYTIRVKVTDNGAVTGADPSARSTIETVNFTINSAPEAISETLDLEADQSQPAAIEFRANDANGDPYTVDVTPDAGNDGTATGAGNTKDYTWPATYTGIDTFDFFATDDKNGVGPTGTLSVSVRPNTTIDAAVPNGSNPNPGSNYLGATTSTDAEFDFSSPQTPVVSYECRLLNDGNVIEDWATCVNGASGSKDYSGLADGLNRFEVRAVNADGQADGTPAFRTWRQDTTAPVARVLVGPPSDAPNIQPRPTNDPSPSYRFDADDRSPQEFITYECRVMFGPSAGIWKSCGSPSDSQGSAQVDFVGPGTDFTLGLDLTEGVYDIQVRATDDVGLTGPATLESFRVDLTPPVTSIASGPSGLINSRDVTYQVTSTEANSTFNCLLTGQNQGVLYNALCPGGAAPNFTGLADDIYTLEITAIDQATNNDPTPPVAEFEIDATEPETTGGDVDFGSGITLDRLTQERRITAGFAGTDSRQLQGFQCRVDSTDDEDWQTCQSPETYSGFADGDHRLEIRSLDQAGNTDSSPIIIDWTIDVTAPVTEITSGPSGVTNDGDPVVEFSTNEPATSECSIDGRAWAPCTSPVSMGLLNGSPLDDGVHTFAVRSADPAQNLEATAAAVSWRQDTILPVVEITAAPAPAVAPGDVDFGWSVKDGSPPVASPESDAECQIDAGPWEPCDRSLVVSGAADGPHTFSVRATDQAGNVSLQADHAWVVLGAPPVAPNIDNSDPADGATTRFKTASFAFSHPDADLPVQTIQALECRVDSGAWADCESPFQVSALADGAHRFEVRARDVAGNTGPAAAANWEVQSSAPVTTINSGPNGLSSQNSATVTFSSNKAGTFECSTNGGAWADCSSPLELSGLADGPYNLRIRAVSSVAPVGVKDPTPASRNWTVDTTAPETTIDSAPSGSTEETGAQILFSSNDPSAAFQCSLDAANFSGCSSPLNLSNLPTGIRTLQVRAIDLAGNTDATPEEASWTITAPEVPVCPPGTQGTPPDCTPLPPVVGDKLVATLTSGELSIAALGEVPLPAGQLVLTGALDRNGAWGIPQAGVNFLPVEQTLDAPGIGQVTVKISITATGPGSGTLPNGGGSASFSLPVQAKVEALLGAIPIIGPDADCFLRPIQFDLNGTYDEGAKTATLSSAGVTFPPVSAGCGPLGGTVNDLIGLPRNDIGITLNFDVVKTVAPSGAPRLARPVVRAAKRVRSGKRLNVTSIVRNVGTAAARNVRVCFRAPRSLVEGRSTACKTVPSIGYQGSGGAGGAGKARMSFKTKPGKKNRKLRVTVTVRYSAGGQIKVARRGHVTVLK
jgi:hypothetical protein